MTIVEAIKTVLYQVPDGLTSKEIYDEIVKQNLYSFGAKNPLGVVNSQIRRRCAGLDFPTAYPVKVFRIAGHRGNKNKFALYDESIPQDNDQHSIVKKYMHESSEKISSASKAQKLNIQAEIIYPDIHQTFWARVIGLGYPTPEPPGFRWCTERLKINPMNKFVEECIKTNGEIIILLGVRKAESAARSRSISEKEIAGYLLNPHNNINNAYVYNPLTEIENSLVWEYLLKDNGISPWGTSMKQLFSLYQGEDLSEEQSVLGEIDEKKIPITGNSRFGCWCCTLVKEDKSLQTMKIFEELGTSQGLQPFALSKIAIALSIRFGSLSDEDFSADTEGLELNRQTIFGEYEVLFKALLAMEKKTPLSDEDFFPTLVKAHLDRGAKLLKNESRYGMHFYKNLLELDCNL